METEYNNRLNYLKRLQSKGDKRLGGVDIEALAKNKMLYNAFVQDRDGKYYDDYPKTANWTPADSPPPYKSFGQKVYDKLSPYFPSTIIGNKYDSMSDESKKHASNIKEGVGYFGRKINDKAKEVVRNSIKPYDDILNAVDNLWQTKVTDMSKHPRIPSGEKQIWNESDYMIPARKLSDDEVKRRNYELELRKFSNKHGFDYEKVLEYDKKGLLGKDADGNIHIYNQDQEEWAKRNGYTYKVKDNKGIIREVDPWRDRVYYDSTGAVREITPYDAIQNHRMRELTQAEKDSIGNSWSKSINMKKLRKYLNDKDITEENYKDIE